MINGKLHTDESVLKNVFESGYSNAAAALSKFVPDNIQGTIFHFGLHRLDTRNALSDLQSFERNGPSLLITTDVFGEISGKSYLFLSEQDINALTNGICGNSNFIENLKEEVLKELDNILSASVITKIANELSMKVYGDVPVLVGRTGSSINSIILDDFDEQSEEVYINAAFFSFENHPQVNPFFVWVMESSILHALQAKSAIKRAS